MSTDSPTNDEPQDEGITPEISAEPSPVEQPEAVTPDVPAEPEVPATEVPSSELPELTLGSGGADPALSTDYVPTVLGKIDRFGVAMGTGRRKTSVARVRVKEGSGQFVVNGRTLDEYFCVERDRQMVLAPIQLVGKEGKVDVSIRVNGGGTTGQTGAIVLGLGRALQSLQPESHHDLAAAGFLTRDSRMVERKKYGLRKARRSYQFSKR
jgi:small subunit ribosomal protein S9